MNKDFDMVHVRLVHDARMLGEEPIITPEAAIEFVKKELVQYDREVLVLVNLSTKAVPINMQIASMGDISSSIVTGREIFKSSILSNAASIILFHNHPSGDPSASQADISVTKKIALAGELLGIEVVDHIIVGGKSGKYFSMMEEHLLGKQVMSQWRKGMLQEKGRTTKSMRHL
ncbi:DNA repair protein RadC [Aequitasia blattaphilus]|uniref:JAB domain-containing protein n=1 Tax=Aequitasia blattaphilus TaxID=2949332 RepID=A0ABT1E841_9FIRM|nr:JAB domain-containing protein [Aequitasia blattaphilus]MCP1101998.1 JAB domain-containing protein [Aequitasia blattaphilus]MCR8614638.1 JAB domain-containing protein [Aequitasia blattaphilus]